MSKLLKKYYHHLHVLKACSCQKRIDFVKKSPNDFVKCLCEVCDNLLKGNIPVNKKQKQQLYRYRNTLRFLASKKHKSLSKKRKIIQLGGAFLPILLPPLLTIAADLLPSLFSK